MRLYVKNRFWISTTLSTMFAAGLIACGGGTTTPTVSSVLVSGPTTATLKINEGTAFTATARDSGGTTIAGKSFTWASSDTNIATVAVGGIVTAKRIGTVKISATTDSVKGESAAQTTFGLEVSGGIYKGVNIGTTFVTKLRLADGSTPTATIGITGPSGWNTTGTPVSLNHNPFTWGIDFDWRALIPAVAGTYQATTNVNGNIFSGSFEIDPNSSIPLVTGITLSNVTTTQADLSWTAPAGANGFIGTIWQDNPSPQADTIVSGANIRTPNTNLKFRTITLDPTKQYYVIVLATNAAWTPDNPALPPQTNISRAFTDPTFSPAP